MSQIFNACYKFAYVKPLFQTIQKKKKKGHPHILSSSLHPSELQTLFWMPSVFSDMGFSATQCSNHTTAGSCCSRALCCVVEWYLFIRVKIGEF